MNQNERNSLDKGDTKINEWGKKDFRKGRKYLKE